MKCMTAIALVAILMNSPAFADLYQENWANEDIGIVDPFQNYCSAEGNLINPPCNIPDGKKYGTFTNVNPSCISGPNACYDVDTSQNPHKFYFHGENTGQYVGLPILSKQRFDQNDYISIEASMKAYCGPSSTDQCFVGLTLFNGEGNYREIAFRNSTGSSSTMDLRMISNCDDHGLISPATGAPLTVSRNSEHKLRLDYYGHVAGGKWVYYVDDVVQWLSIDNDGYGVGTEPPYNRTACTDGKTDLLQLQNPPRYGFYLLGWQNVGTYSEGSVGPVSVYTKRYEDQAQKTQSDGIGLTNSTWIAQRVQMGSGHNNTTMAELFLIDQQHYAVEAYTDNNGQMGTLINSTSYKADRYGMQHVPLWVPSYYQNYWIVVKGLSSNAGIGTTAHGSQPYNGTFLYTTNSGANWAPLPRNLTFATYSRQ